jgi:NAD(P)-dependent dehydrogenase (short-subunit alcohol dehydrogenase family)
MKEFKGKVAVVTGAASGIGLALSKRFAAEGMKIVMADIEERALIEAGKKLRAKGATILQVVTDVSKPKDVDELAGKTINTFGAVHILCNNAGVFRGGTSWEVPLEDYAWMLGVNLFGVIHGIRSFMPILSEQDVEAHIVNTSSSTGLFCTPYTAAYCLSKHAIVVLSECLYHELFLSGSKVKVSVLLPTAVVTNIPGAERNRQDRFMPSYKANSDMADVIAAATADSINKGITPAKVADKVMQAIREERFYILAGGSDVDSLMKMINNRLDDIRELRNPTFPIPDDMMHMLETPASSG